MIWLLLISFIQAKDLGGVKSRYTGPIEQVIQHWPPPELDFSKIGAEALDIQFIATPENDYYVGVRQAMHVKASIESVAKVVGNFGEYDKYFPTYKEIKVISESPVLHTYWNQIVDIFLIPNIKFHLLHDVDLSNPKRFTFRYQLKEANLLESCDGVIVLEKDGAKTRYVEFSFAETSPGILRSLGSGPVWSDSLKSYYLSTLGIKLRAENPAWSFAKVVETTQASYDALDKDAILANKVPFYLLGKTAEK